jgi:hypothetical protein
VSKQRIIAGGTIELLTPDELIHFLQRPELTSRVREPASVQLNANGVGVCAVYKVPMGHQFDVRRVTILPGGGEGDPFTQGVAFVTAANTYAIYRRSGTVIEYAQTTAPKAGASSMGMPGAQTWGATQGPYLANGEVFEIEFNVSTAPNAIVTCTVEGVLTRPNPAYLETPSGEVRVAGRGR